MAKYVTIMDIARELGISKSTVSRALAGDTGNVKTETLQKILATAERMGYHRNELAVNFRQQSTHNIGIIIPEIVTTFYMTFINDAQAILRKQGPPGGSVPWPRCGGRRRWRWSSTSLPRCTIA